MIVYCPFYSVDNTFPIVFNGAEKLKLVDFSDGHQCIVRCP